MLLPPHVNEIRLYYACMDRCFLTIHVPPSLSSMNKQNFHPCDVHLPFETLCRDRPSSSQFFMGPNNLWDVLPLPMLMHDFRHFVGIILVELPLTSIRLENKTAYMSPTYPKHLGWKLFQIFSYEESVWWLMKVLQFSLGHVIHIF